VPGPLPGPTPLPSRGLRSSPLPRCAWLQEDQRSPPGTTRSGRLTAPAGWPGAGLRSNIPSIAAMSTGPGGPAAMLWPARWSAPAAACSALSCGDTI